MSPLILAPVESTRNSALGEKQSDAVQVEPLSLISNSVSPVEADLIKEVFEAELPEEDEASQVHRADLLGMSMGVLSGSSAGDIWEDETEITKPQPISPPIGRVRLRRI